LARRSASGDGTCEAIELFGPGRRLLRPCCSAAVFGQPEASRAPARAGQPGAGGWCPAPCSAESRVPTVKQQAHHPRLSPSNGTNSPPRRNGLAPSSKQKQQADVDRAEGLTPLHRRSARPQEGRPGSSAQWQEVGAFQRRITRCAVVTEARDKYRWASEQQAAPAAPGPASNPQGPAGCVRGQTAPPVGRERTRARPRRSPAGSADPTWATLSPPGQPWAPRHSTGDLLAEFRRCDALVSARSPTRADPHRAGRRRPARQLAASDGPAGSGLQSTAAKLRGERAPKQGAGLVFAIGQQGQDR